MDSGVGGVEVFIRTIIDIRPLRCEACRNRTTDLERLADRLYYPHLFDLIDLKRVPADMFLPRRPIFACAVALVLASVSSAWAVSTLRIEPTRTRTRVGIARVHLEITDLRIDRDRFIGTYEVTIPLAPWRNDRGRI